ncbi:hypothetical protein Poli38472_003323 [Pythium oligandrum]|uniref:Uncharacterized protein n=1 Tax=Pythium oligandrum TaxID=41045 RepID=A0A8K1C6Y8_PYTOL|nr:hypothetical protein Poli38472_003323 [Pythium oligandrum]|eukprot:TMW57398.1 hypothetical protein Poli38472_003323 [Pythium oligandrum]
MLLVASLSTVDAFRRRSIDVEALEKAWEAGDAVQELESHADEQYERLKKIPEAEARAIGPQMVFVTLREQPEDASTLAAKWKEMLWNGGLEVNIYEIDAHKVLVGLQKGMYITELQGFLKDQSIVREYEWNGQTYHVNTLPVSPTSAQAKPRVKKPKKKKKKKESMKSLEASANSLMTDEL